ncbi:MAG: class I SAM-dependent methyltransferase [Myxococcota bacterium]
MTDLSLIERAFDATRAKVYDDQFVELQAVKDLMHLIARVHFSDLPRTAKILVAGAGTGAEVRFLAGLFPEWHFTLADPSKPMLDVAKRHAVAEGFLERCVFHAGFVSTLEHDLFFDAATSILVSQFLTEHESRADYFSSIAKRLKPGGLLFNADLCRIHDEKLMARAMELWLRVLGQSAASAAQDPEQYRSMFGRDFAAHSAAEVIRIIEGSEFRDVLQCYQAGLIWGWTAVRS